ncbi:membrane-associated phospholipid phosphatase [Actinoplanes octamycinicus]|uniref:Membrane-associated phospholipid phosphatase n=1 Tax=Actinoplanes octamycinicus TaxID=135948 RepID=A0A7W7GT17_9ACTN|nr:phosphatase PAP2 family protein [Actinoplanes octamycinicus]MBB4737738.1 membrane-associated phospholipid phosphatase [Actinoplanes octamycinicus]GIE58039.1 phosphatidic acid phosphatase [Actinoplanes octamycinicus]
MIQRRTLAWWPDLLLLAAFAALTVALIDGHLLGLDQRVADWSLSHQPWLPYWTARVLNYLGQGGQVLTPVALILTGLLVHRTRSARAALPFVAAYVVTYLTIGPMKIFFDRAAPRYTGPFKVEMFNPVASGDLSRSYPSGHMGNSLVWYAVFAILVAALLRRALTRREFVAIRVLPVAIVFVTTVYTGFHWLTDSIAGLLLGLVLARFLERIPWDRVPLPALRGWNRPAFSSSR